MDAAEQLLYSKGSEDAVSVREIARAVGCTPPALYLHFKDKEELFLEICARRFEQFDEFVERAAAGVEDPLESLRVRGKAYVRFGLDHPEHYRLLMMTPKEKTPQEIVEDKPGAGAFIHLVEAVQRCFDSGDLTGRDPMDVTYVLWAGVHGITSLMITFPNFVPRGEQQIDLMLDVVIEGLLAT